MTLIQDSRNTPVSNTVNFFTVPGFSSWQTEWIKTDECATLECKLHVPPSDNNTWALCHSLSRCTLLCSASRFYNCSLCPGRGKYISCRICIKWCTLSRLFIGYFSSLKWKMYVYGSTCWTNCLCAFCIVFVCRLFNVWTSSPMPIRLFRMFAIGGRSSAPSELKRQRATHSRTVNL